MADVIRKIEVDDFAIDPVNCPFCGQHAILFEEDGHTYEVNPCPHMLFACYDDGWDYLADRTIENLVSIGYEVDPEDDLETVTPSDLLSEDDHYSPDHITDRITITGAIKYAAYQPPPSFYGSYVGFAPLPDHSGD